MLNLKTRIALILALVAASVFMLFPRTTVERVRRDGAIVYDTVRRVPLKLGLDLQGGMHLALEVDESRGTVANKSEALDRALKVVRTRVDEFGVSEPVVQKAGDERIIVELPGIDDPDRAVALVQKSAYLQFQITDKTSALQRVLPRLDAIVRARAPQIAAAGRTPSAPTATSSLFSGADTTAGRTLELGALDSARADSAADTAAVALATDGPFSSKLRPGAMPGQFFVAGADYNAIQSYLEMPEIRGALPPGKVVKWGADSVALDAQSFGRALYVLDSRPIITGEYLTDARPEQSPMEGTVVTFTLNNVGGRRFKAETAKHIQDNMAIVLDERVITAPTIQSSIGTNGQITLGRGADNVQEAQDLALVLRAGALPVPLKVAEVRNIGASLGQDSIDQGMRALGIAVLLIVIIMVGYYRFSGLLAVGALLLYMLYTMAVLSGFDAVLTLPGLAGLILSIGIAVDANVLIFERIREELDRGKTPRTAIDEGFKHALSAIVDTSVTTILTAAILYQYGTGPVRGFAVTLIAGILASMFTAIFVTRTFYLIWLNRARAGQTLSI